MNESFFFLRFLCETCRSFFFTPRLTNNIMEEAKATKKKQNLTHVLLFCVFCITYFFSIIFLVFVIIVFMCVKFSSFAVVLIFEEHDGKFRILQRGKQPNRVIKMDYHIMDFIFIIIRNYYMMVIKMIKTLCGWCV
jgi:hypothetical protein